VPPHAFIESQAGYAGFDFSAHKVAELALGEGHRSEERALKAQAEAVQQLQPQALTLSAFAAVPPHEPSKNPPDNPELALREDQLAKERALKVLTLLALLVQKYKY
jgi:hypothetical protein